MDRKAFNLKALDETGSGEAVIATLGVIDRDGDVIEPGAFGEQTAKLIPAHDWSSVWLGKARVFERDNEAVAAFKINLDIPAAKDWHSALKFDLKEGQPIGEWSWGFSVDESGDGEMNGQRVRMLKRVTVHEVSPVLLGAGINTRTLSMKSGLRFSEQLSSVLEDVRAAIKRGQSIREMRVAKGAELSKARVEQLGDIKAALVELNGIALEIEAAFREEKPVDTAALVAGFEHAQSTIRAHLRVA